MVLLTGYNYGITYTNYHFDLGIHKSEIKNYKKRISLTKEIGLENAITLTHITLARFFYDRFIASIYRVGSNDLENKSFKSDYKTLISLISIDKDLLSKRYLKLQKYITEEYKRQQVDIADFGNIKNSEELLTDVAIIKSGN